MKDRKVILVVILLTLVLIMHCEVVKAQDSENFHSKFGVGIMLGEPTGVSVKIWNGHVSAFDIGAAWSVAGKYEALHLNGDFLLHNWFNDTKNLAFYYGVGVRLILTAEAHAGVRVPFGLNYVFDNIPFDLFIEAAPILDFTPRTEFAGNGAVGLRYYF